MNIDNATQGILFAKLLNEELDLVVIIIIAYCFTD